MKLLQPFGASPQGRNNDSGPHSHISREPRNEIFLCDAPGCVLTYRNENEAQDHMDSGTHQLVLERETVYDTIRRKWAQYVTGIVFHGPLNALSRPIHLRLTCLLAVIII